MSRPHWHGTDDRAAMLMAKQPVEVPLVLHEAHSMADTALTPRTRFSWSWNLPACPRLLVQEGTPESPGQGLC